MSESKKIKFHKKKSERNFLWHKFYGDDARGGNYFVILIVKIKNNFVIIKKILKTKTKNIQPLKNDIGRQR